MKQSIIKITLYAFIISGIVLFYTHQEVLGRELVNSLSSNSQSEDIKKENDEEFANDINFSNNYANNSTSNDITENPKVTSSAASSGIDNNSKISVPNIVINKVTNENITTSSFASNDKINFDAQEFGPNNNFEELYSENVVNNNFNNSNQPEAIKSSSEDNYTNEVKIDFTPITPTLSSPPPPGGDGEDPFSAPLDDFYGLGLLLMASTIFGIFKIRQKIN